MESKQNNGFQYMEKKTNKEKKVNNKALECHELMNAAITKYYNERDRNWTSCIINASYSKCHPFMLYSHW